MSLKPFCKPGIPSAAVGESAIIQVMNWLQGTANENAVSLRRFCKISDQLKNKHE